ncbi:unnamed protein product, partial [Ectocarpus fasciculatus]
MATLYLNPVMFTFYTLPYLLRGIRVVILSHKVWRARYIGLLSRNNVLATLGITYMVLNGICAILQQVPPLLYGNSPTEWCFLFGDWWLWGSIGAAMIMGTAKLFLELTRVKDKINMA